MLSIPGFLVLLLLLSAERLRAQEPGDYLISEGPFDYSLPSEILLQAAWELDSTARLAVWGTIGYDGTNERRNILIANLNGRQFQLTGPQAIPYQTVGILPLDDRFLVVWNDRRAGGEGLYGQVVMPDGSLEGEEMLLGSGVVKPVFVASWITEDRGRFMLWQDSVDGRESTYGLAVTPDGRPDGEVVKIAESSISTSEIYTMPGGQLLVHLNDGKVVVIRPNGRIDGRPIPSRRLDIPHYHTGDSSLAVLDGTHLHFYRSLYDELPEKTVDLSSILTGKYIQVLSRDSLGWLLNYRTTLRQGKTEYQLSHNLYFDPENVIDTFSTTRQVGVWGEPPQATNVIEVESGGWVRYTGVNVAQVYAYRTHRIKIPSSPTPFTSSEHISYYVVGEYRVENGFLRPPRPRITRSESEGESSVRVIWNMPKDTSYFTTAVVPSELHVSHRLLGISTRDDTICVQYDTLGGNPFCRCYTSLFDEEIEGCLKRLELIEPGEADTVGFVTPEGVRILIQGSPQGVRATFFDQYDNVLYLEDGTLLKDLRVSRSTGRTARPVGFLHDGQIRLFWEDHSSPEEVEIYGTWLNLPKRYMTDRGEIIIFDTVSSPPDLDRTRSSFFRGIRIHDISPNPALGQTVLTIDVRYFYGYAGISFFDTRGREVRRFAVDVTDGMYSFPLDLSGLSSGPYEVRVRTYVSLDSKRLVIWQE